MAPPNRVGSIAYIGHVWLHTRPSLCLCDTVYVSADGFTSSFDRKLRPTWPRREKNEWRETSNSAQLGDRERAPTGHPDRPPTAAYTAKYAIRDRFPQGKDERWKISSKNMA